MKSIKVISVLCISTMLLLGSQTKADDTNPSGLGGCGPVTISPPTLGNNLQLNGIPGCTVELHSTPNDCSVQNDTTGTTILGLFSMDGSGFVDTGIPVQSICYMVFEIKSTTNPLGRMFVPEDSTNVAANEATIGGTVSVNLDFTGVDGELTYNGTTFSGLPAGAFMLNNIVGNATSVTTRANGFEGSGKPITDSSVGDLNFVAPTCGSASQTPDSTLNPVDIGTVITLDLVTAGATSALINGVPMTPDVDPNTNNSVTWSASYTAIESETVTATLTNPNGAQEFCEWQVSVNCIATFFSVAPVGQTGIVIQGTPGCDHTITITDSNMVVSMYDVTIGNDGFASLDIVVPPDSLLEVIQDSFLTGPLPVPTTVPTLGNMFMLFMLLLIGTVGFISLKQRQH